MISIVSMVRRGSVVVSFTFGALFFREKNLKSKAIDLILVLIGMIFLYLGSKKLKQLHKTVCHGLNKIDMKINKLVITIFFSAVGLFCFDCSSGTRGQNVVCEYAGFSKSLCLQKVNREDCIDFLESKMKAQVENRFGKKSEMTDLSKDYIRMQMSAQSTLADESVGIK